MTAHTPAKRQTIRHGLARTLAVVALAAASAVVAPLPASAQQVQRIAAVVNDDVISMRDVQERLALTMAISSIPNSPENQKKILPNVVRALVDDQLREQEAKRLKITVNDSDVDSSIRRIEESNHIPPGSTQTMLSQAGIPYDALRKQIHAQVAWIKSAQQSLRRQIVIQPEEIDATLAQLKAVQGRPQAHVAELVIPVNDPAQEQEAKSVADRLVDQIRQGARFSALAQQFSSAATARQGGDLGWLTEGQLMPELEQAVRALAPGQVSAPLRSATGYTLLFLVERREAKASKPEDIAYDISQIYMPTSGRAAIPEQRRNSILQSLKSANSCDDLNAVAEREKLPSSGNIGQQKLASLPPAISQVVATLPNNKLSQPIMVTDAQVVMMVCGRNDPNGLPSRDEVSLRLEREKLERLADRRLRDLRRQALIDIRL